MLFSHRIADYAANPVSSGAGNYTYVGATSSNSLPTGSQEGDLCLVGVTVTNGSSSNPTVGFTSVRGGSLGAYYVGLYVKALTATDISRGTYGSTPTFLFAHWTQTYRPSTPATGFTVTGQANGSGPAAFIYSMEMTASAPVPGMIVAYGVHGATLTTPFTIDNAVTTPTNYSINPTHKLSVELTQTGNANTPRTTGNSSALSDAAYVATIFGLTAT